MKAADSWLFKTLYFVDSSPWMDRRIKEIVDEGQEAGYEFHDLKFAQSSASGTGMSAIVIMRKAR